MDKCSKESVEPMNMDLSSSFNRIKQTIGIDSSNTKKNKRKTKHYFINKPKQKSKSYLNIVLISMCGLFIGYYMNIKCSGPFNADKIKENLMSKLYGQATAINSIIEALDSDNQSKLVVFHGGTGVGKSYASHIIIDDLKQCSNVYHYTHSSFIDNFPCSLLHGCNSTLIVIDDLVQENNDFYFKLKDLYTKSKTLEKQLTVILIYNCDVIQKDFKKGCDKSMEESIQLNVNDIEATKFFVKFYALTELELEKCIQDAITFMQIRDVDTQELKKLLKMFDVASDGCKDVYGKIKSFVF